MNETPISLAGAGVNKQYIPLNDYNIKGIEGNGDGMGTRRALSKSK